MRSFFMRPPLVYILVPFHTWSLEPVWDFLVTFLAFLATRFGALAFEALRAALGALGLAARRVLRALRAARRVVLRAAFLGALALEALRATALTAMMLFV